MSKGRAWRERRERLRRNKDSGEGAWRSHKHSPADWRLRFFSIFVGNLKTSVSSADLWRIFEEYGGIVDVFIQRKSNRRSTYAFVRFKDEAAMWKAVTKGDGRKINGWSATVRRASMKKKKEHNTEFVPRNPKHDGRQAGEPIGKSWEMKDCRSYAQAVSGAGRVEEPFESDQEASTGECNQVVKEQEAVDETVLTLDPSVLSGSLQWLERSAVGRLREYMHPKTIQGHLERQGIPVTVTTYGGLTVLLSFSGKEEMLCLLQSHGDFFSVWFQSVHPWDRSFVCKDRFSWITMVGVPLHLWHPAFFKEVGNMLGSFIATDESTSLRCRFDVAKILVATESTFEFPSHVKIMVEDNCHTIQLFDSPAFDFIRLASDGRLPGSGERLRSRMDSSVSSSTRSEKVSDTSNGFSSSWNVLGGDNDEVSPVHGMSDTRITQQVLDNVETAGSPILPIAYSPPLGRPVASLDDSRSGPDEVVQPTHVSPTLSYERAKVDGPTSSKEKGDGYELGPMAEVNWASPSNRQLQIVMAPTSDQQTHISDEVSSLPNDSEGDDSLPIQPRFFKQRNRRQYRTTFNVHHGISKGDSINSLSDDDIIRRNTIIRKEVDGTLEIAEKMLLKFERQAPAIATKLMSKRLKGRKV